MSREVKTEPSTFKELDDLALKKPCYHILKQDLIDWQTNISKRPNNSHLLKVICSTEDDEILEKKEKPKTPEYRGESDEDSNDYDYDYEPSESEIITIKTNYYKVDFLLKNGFLCLDDEPSFTQLITSLFSRSAITYLELFEKYYPKRILLTHNLIKKAVLYGRYRVLEFLEKYYKPKLLELLSETNPYDIDIDNFRHFYINDIWDNWTWGNDECEKPVIKQHEINHFKVIKMLDRISSDHKTMINLNEDVLKKWIKISLLNPYIPYLLDYKKILTKYFGEVTTLNSRNSVVKLVDLIGYKYAWRIVSNMNSDILKILLDKD